MTVLIEFKRNDVVQYTPGVDSAYQVYIKDYLNFDEDVFFPYISDPKVQIGRYQNVHSEVNIPYCRANGIAISRRDTGGGAVYTDRGNTSYCFLMKTDDSSYDLNFKKMYEPIIKVLHELGATEVQLSNRNDLEIEGRKVSGGAMSLEDGVIYGGFTLILDVDYEPMVESLNPNNRKMLAKGIKSVRKSVTGLRPYLLPEYQNLTSEEFMEVVTAKLLGLDDISQANTYELTDEDWATIDKMSAEKYNNWEWNFGESPQFDAIKEGYIEDVGNFHVTVSVEHSRISQINIFGDYKGKSPTSEVEDKLIGLRYEYKDIKDVLDKVSLKKYFNGKIAKELAELITQ